MTTFLVLVGVAVGSYVARILFVQLVPASRLPLTVQTQLAHLGPAVLGALTATALARTVASSGRLDPVPALAVVSAALVGWWTRSVGWLLVTGIGVAVVLGSLS